MNVKTFHLQAPLNAEVNNEGEVAVSGGDDGPVASWNLGKMCVGWDNPNKLLRVCNLVKESAFEGDEIYSMDCEDSYEDSCEDAIDAYNDLF